MAVKDFNDDTLKALQAGGIGEEPKGTPDVTPDVKPDIKLNLDADIKPDVTPDATPDIKITPVTEPDPLVESGIDIKAMQERVIKEGGFSDELVAELKEKLDPALVDKHVAEYNEKLEAAKKEQAVKLSAEDKARGDMNKYIYGAVGGEDNFRAMGDILVSNLSEADKNLINAKLKSGNKALVDEGLKQAVAEYNKATGRGSTRMEGDAQGEVKEAFHFMTKRSYQTLITTDKYKTDAAYAAKVDADRLKSKGMDNARHGPGQYFSNTGSGVYAI